MCSLTYMFSCIYALIYIYICFCSLKIPTRTSSAKHSKVCCIQNAFSHIYVLLYICSLFNMCSLKIAIRTPSAQHSKVCSIQNAFSYIYTCSLIYVCPLTIAIRTFSARLSKGYIECVLPYIYICSLIRICVLLRKQERFPRPSTKQQQGTHSQKQNVLSIVN